MNAGKILPLIIFVLSALAGLACRKPVAELSPQEYYAVRKLMNDEMDTRLANLNKFHNFGYAFRQEYWFLPPNILCNAAE